MNHTLKALALVGARLRLTEISRESAAILAHFPELAEAQAEAIPDGPPKAKRKPMTGAQRLAVGRRMRKYWAARRKAGARQ